MNCVLDLGSKRSLCYQAFGVELTSHSRTDPNWPSSSKATARIIILAQRILTGRSFPLSNHKKMDNCWLNHQQCLLIAIRVNFLNALAISIMKAGSGLKHN